MISHDDVVRRVADRRRRAEHGELQARVLGLAPVRQVREPHQRRADHRADELARQVLGNVTPLRVADRREPERHRRVEMRAAELADREDADHHAHRPAPGDHDPAGVLGLGLAQQHRCHHTVAQQDQERRPDRLRSEDAQELSSSSLVGLPTPNESGHYPFDDGRPPLRRTPSPPCRAACGSRSRRDPGGRRCAGRGSSRAPCGPPAGSVARIPSSAAAAERRSASPSSSPSAALSASSAGSSASTMVLSPAWALPRAWTPVTAASSASVQPARSSSSFPPALRGELQEQRPVQRAGGAADGRDERHPDGLEQRADVVALLRVELLDHLAHPPVHVGAVVAVADRRVELGQLGPALGDAVREGVQPVADGGAGDAHPMRSAGVSHGASHSRVSSSSSLSSVIEQPAISSEVM